MNISYNAHQWCNVWTLNCSILTLYIACVTESLELSMLSGLEFFKEFNLYATLASPAIFPTSVDIDGFDIVGYLWHCADLYWWKYLNIADGEM